MAEFLANGRSIDLVLLMIVLEAVALIVLWRMRICPLPPRATLLILAPGTFLLLAARAALAGDPWPWVSSLFLAALFIHLVDLRQRWRERGADHRQDLRSDGRIGRQDGQHHP